MLDKSGRRPVLKENTIRSKISSENSIDKEPKMALIQNRKHKETNTLFHVKMRRETQTYPPFVKQTNYYDRCQLRVMESTYSGQYWFKQRAPGTVGAQPLWAAVQ